MDMLFQDCFAVVVVVDVHVCKGKFFNSIYLHLAFLFIVLSFDFESILFLCPFKAQFLLTAVAESRTAALPNSPTLTCELLPR